MRYLSLTVFVIALVNASCVVDAGTNGSETNREPNQGQADTTPITMDRAGTTPITEGEWAGKDILLRAEKSSVAISFVCADGYIHRQLQIAQNGDFSVEGTYRRIGPGPQREDESDGIHAIFSGKVSNKQMTLKVVLSSGEVVGTFILEHGKRTRLHRCL